MGFGARLAACAVLSLTVACSSTPLLGSGDGEPKTAYSGGKKKRKHKKRRAKSVEKLNPYQEEDSAQAGLPRHCSRDNGRCYPPKEFVRHLCLNKYPSVAVAMFHRGAPWQHAFVKVKDVRAINALGGPVNDARLEFSEEVLLLQHHPYAHTDGMQISGGLDRYIVLRFDGTCATLAEDEFMSFRPGRSRYAPLIWRELDRGMRRTLSESKHVEKARRAQNEDCGGLYLAGGSRACREATQKLAKAIIVELNRGVDLPTPQRIPDWSED
jgi:hypothetical protein